jgi:Tol biopolymer transport system component/DNA-binding winged helix-turn-helix (wHTH) protein
VLRFFNTVTYMNARFGPFELDTVSCMLKQDGIDLHLANRSLALLMLLIGRRGELVTRDEIQTALWPTETFVETERINSAIRRLRAALGEDSASPKYIETVPRRGYRFIAVVAIDGELASKEVGEPALAEPVGGVRRFRLAAVLAGIAMIAVGLFSYAASHPLVQASGPPMAWEPITKQIHTRTRIASDGTSVFWTEVNELGCRPWQAAIDGSGDATPISMPFTNAYVADANLDGQLLVIARKNCQMVDPAGLQGPIWELAPATGTAQRVGDITGYDAAWSHDARQIAFAKWKEIWLAERDGSRPRRLAILPGSPNHIRWSPDGKLLRFTIHPDSEYRYPLWEADANTGAARPVLPEWTDGNELMGGAWTTRGDFAFIENRSRAKNVWRMVPGTFPLQGHSLYQVTAGPLEFSALAAIPGRDELAVVGSQSHGELNKFDPDARRFVPSVNGISAEMVDFSRDGKWMAYVTYPERELWRSRVDGTEALQLVNGSLKTALPRISPDGRRVAFTGDYSGKEMRTWIVAFDGGTPKTVTKLVPGTAELAPTWSPDGKRLLYRLDLAIQKNVLQIADVASGRAEDVPGSNQMLKQRWSPDGKWIVAVTNQQDRLEVFNFEKGEWTTLTEMRVDSPNWSSKSDFVVYCAILENGEQVAYRVDVATHKTEKITSLTGAPRAFNETYGEWMGIGPEDLPMLLKSETLQRIYLLKF